MNYLIIYNLKVGSSVFNPTGDAIEDSLYMARIITHSNAGDNGALLIVVEVNLSSRNVEMFM